jgi:regulator of sigma E protease
MQVVYYAIGALGLAILMVVHEAGHYFAARSYGMRVLKFSIGFGPTFFKIEPEDGYYWFTSFGRKLRLRLWKHIPEKHGPTVFQVAMIPVLAYVQIAGMNPLEPVDPKDKGSYANASLMGRIVTIFAGPLANYLFASVFFFVSIFFGGKVFLSTDINVLPGKPAAMANIKDGDRIVSLDGVVLEEWEKMAEIIAKSPNKPLAVVLDRNGERVETTMTPADDGGRGRVGVAARGPNKRVPVTAGEAGKLALIKPAQVVKDLVVGLSQYIRGKADGELAGPAGIVKETARAAKSGWTDLMYLLGALSAYLGAFNLIPFPALDGMRLVFLGYEATTRRRADARIEQGVHAVGFAMLMCLVLWVTIFKDFGLGK